MVKEGEDTKPKVSEFLAELAALQSQAQVVFFKSLAEKSPIPMAIAHLRSAFPEFARVGPVGKALERWLSADWHALPVGFVVDSVKDTLERSRLRVRCQIKHAVRVMQSTVLM